MKLHPRLISSAAAALAILSIAACSVPQAKDAAAAPAAASGQIVRAYCG